MPRQPGTYQFYPPECITKSVYNNIYLYKAVDIWALGCLLYAGIYGILPFDGNNLDELFTDIMEKE